MLAIVPAGRDNPFVPDEAPSELRHAANQYWVDRYLPWHRRRTAFREAVSDARVVELDTSNHTVFVAREDDTVRAIFDFISDRFPSGHGSRVILEHTTRRSTDRSDPEE